MTLPNIPEILNDIWAQGQGSAVFMPTQKRPGRAWRPSPPVVPPLQAALDQEWGYDQYFTPMTFFSGELRGDKVAPGKVLYADLDRGVYMIPPTYLWETSPGSLQAVWFTYETMDPEYHANLNKRLTYWCNADKGGWGAAKVLRVPGTLNFKRQYEDDGGIMVPRGHLILHDPRARYHLSDLDEMMPTLSEVDAPTGEVPQIPATRPPASELPMGLRALLVARYDDRSKRCFTVAKEFAARELPPEVAWDHMWYAPFNKYTDRPEVLWATIQRAYSK